MIFVDLTILASPRHLAACMFLARASEEQLRLQRDDLHQLYWLAAGAIAFRGYNEQHHAFEDFFFHKHDEMKSSLPTTATLDSLISAVLLVEHGLDQGWITFAREHWGPAEFLLGKLFALPSSALYGINDWDGSLETFLDQPWTGEPDETSRGRSVPPCTSRDAAPRVLLQRAQPPPERNRSEPLQRHRRRRIHHRSDRQ